jgi:hypothetical protein
MRQGLAAWLLALACAGTALGAETDPWAGYLDFAYVYSSAEPPALRARLAGYAREAGRSLPSYLREDLGTFASLSESDAETVARRRAVAELLLYLAEGDTAALERSAEAARALGPRLGRHENRYWYHYVLAHGALEQGDRREFVKQVLDLWLHVIVPLESPYATLDTISLAGAPSSGFVSALPYLYENVARLVLLRSQEMGLDSGLDPLGAIVRLLRDGRIGAHPDVIPAEATSAAYLERIVERLDGPESDDGSLTFVLALFEAGKLHDRARGLLASEGLSPATLEAVRLTTGGYTTALRRADTAQGEAAVYTRVLRQLGELHAAKQRLGVDPEIQTPFTIEDAIQLYDRLAQARAGGHEALGWRSSHRTAYLEAMRGLWFEIQEVSLNVGDYYLARAAAAPHRADEHARSATRVFTRYLAFFHHHASADSAEVVPDAAYFAAFEAARGVGDALLAFATAPTSAEIELATQRYTDALAVFPFDRELYPALTRALAHHGREGQFAEIVRPLADRVTRSRSVESWIQAGEAYAAEIAALRQALADSLAVMYLGFADPAELGRLEAELEGLRGERDAVAAELERLRGERQAVAARPLELPASIDEEEDAPAEPPADVAALEQLAARLSTESRRLTRLEQQVEARSRALPLYRGALETPGMAGAMRKDRAHPVHALLRRMYHESRS